MPALERLAREGVVFDRAMSVAPLTLPAHTSLFTGLFPPHHDVRDNAAPALAARYTTLAETLSSRGYCTGAFVSSVVLDPDRGLQQGFERYVSVTLGENGRKSPQRRANEVIDDAIRWLDEDRACPVFLWTHLYDAHRPYEPPEPYRSRHADPYLGEIAFAEAQVDRLLGALERRRLLDNTLLIVVADHGESLGEHGEENHGFFLYESVLRIPLVIRLPRRTRVEMATGTRVADLVRLVDVMPTVLDALGVRAPATDGVSLLGVMNGHHLDLEAYAESMYPIRFGQTPLRALRDGRFKLIDGSSPELYDLGADPFERRNLYVDRRLLAEAMRRRLERRRTWRRHGRPDQAFEVPTELRERLGALGYLGGGVVAGPADGLPDPKNYTGVRNHTTATAASRVLKDGPTSPHVRNHVPEIEKTRKDSSGAEEVSTRRPIFNNWLESRQDSRRAESSELPGARPAVPPVHGMGPAA